MKIPYNIGDFIRSRKYREKGWHNTKNYAIKFCEKYPRSICEEYYLFNLNDKQSTINYYDDDNINYELLNSIIKRRGMHIKETNNIYIHLRIGDVMDKLSRRFPQHKHKDYTEYLRKHFSFVKGHVENLKTAPIKMHK